MIDKLNGFRGGVVAFLLALFALTSHAQEQAFKIGVAPHSSARLILKLYQPLREHLTHELGRPVEVVTAPNFTEFLRRAINQEYDMVITSGNQSRLLQVDAGYRPFLTYKADFKAVTVVDADSRYRRARDLHGQVLLGLNPASLVTQWGMHWAKKNRLGGNEVRYVSAADSVAQLLLAGDAAAGFISLANYQQLTPDVQQGLRIIASSPTMAGRIYSLNGRNAASAGTIERAIWSFPRTEGGRRYFSQYKLKGYRPLRPRELESMDHYAGELRQMLRQP